MDPASPPPSSVRSRRYGQFFSRFLRDPRSVGAVAPSSQYLAAKMLTDVAWQPGVRLAEYGPGTGPFTEAILAALPADGRYFGIELNPAFVAVLHEHFPGADIVEGSVENVVALAEARAMLPLDHVVSGLPFASLPREVTERVLDQTLQALRPGGTFTTFQYLHSTFLPSAIRFRRDMARLFGPVHARRSEVRNLPPAMVYTWRRPG